MCQSAGCSHLCLLVPAGVYCACPDHTHVQQGVSEKICDAGNYRYNFMYFDIFTNVKKKVDKLKK